MSIQPRLADLQRLEDTIRKSMGDLISTLDESNRRRDQADRTCDQTLKELQDGFVALKVQKPELMVKLKADNGGNSSAASNESNTRAQCFPTRQSRVDSPIVIVNDLNGSGTCVTAPNLLQSTTSTPPENLQQRDKLVEKGIARFSAEISYFIGRKTPELKQANSNHYFSNPMAELRSLKQLGMVSDYLNQFKTLLGKVEINESYAVHLFVSGLNHHIHNSVRMFRPKSLVHAFALARLQESALNFRRIYHENEEVIEKVWLEKTVKEDSVTESILTSLEIDEERSLGKEESVEKMDGLLIEEAKKERVMNMQGSSNLYKVPKVRNLGNTHTTSMNHSHLEDRGKRSFRKLSPSIKHELSRELAYKITTGSNEDMCNEKDIAATEQRKEDGSAVIVIQHLALTGSLALAEVKGAKMLSEETEREKEFPPEGNYELMSKTQESKRKQDPGAALTVAKAMSQREFFKLGHHKYWVSFLTRMKGDDGVCISALHLSLSIRKGCSLNLSLLGSLPLEESNRLSLPSHHKGNVSIFGLSVWVLLTGKSPYSHNWVIVEEPRHRKERILRVANEHFYKTERCRVYTMRVGDDIKSLRIASVTIFIEVVGRKVECQNGDNHPGNQAEGPFELNGDEGFSYPRPIYRDDRISRLVGHGGSLFRIARFSTGVNLVSVFDDCYAPTWEVQVEKGIACKVVQEQVNQSVTITLEYASCCGKRTMRLVASFDEELRFYVGKLHDESSTLQESFKVFEIGCSKLGQRRLFFQLLEAILKLGNRMNGEIESAPHNSEEPKHRTERIFRVFKGMFYRVAAGNIQITKP